MDVFKSTWQTAESKYGKNTWEFNKYIWEKWYCQQTGGHPDYGGYVKALDAQAETFIKGTTSWSEINCFSRSNMMYFTTDEINTYWTCGTGGLNFSRTSSNEQERFTTVENTTLGKGSTNETANKAIELAKSKLGCDYVYGSKRTKYI